MSGLSRSQPLHTSFGTSTSSDVAAYLGPLPDHLAYEPDLTSLTESWKDCETREKRRLVQCSRNEPPDGEHFYPFFETLAQDAWNPKTPCLSLILVFEDFYVTRDDIEQEVKHITEKESLGEIGNEILDDYSPIKVSCNDDREEMKEAFRQIANYSNPPAHRTGEETIHIYHASAVYGIIKDLYAHLTRGEQYAPYCEHQSRNEIGET